MSRRDIQDDIYALDDLDDLDDSFPDMSYEYLKDLVGEDAAQTILNHLNRSYDPSFFFDDPEKF